MDEKEIFRRLFAANYEDLLRFVERRVHPVTAEDVVADIFLVAWRRLRDVPKPEEEARAWLFGVAQRTLLNQRRGEARRGSLQVRVGQEQSHITDDHGADVAARVDLFRAWSRLPARDQETLTLTGLDGLTGVQAAHVLNITPTAFSLRLLRARRRLRRQLLRASPSHQPLGSHTAPGTRPTPKEHR